MEGCVMRCKHVVDANECYVVVICTEGVRGEKGIPPRVVLKPLQYSFCEHIVVACSP